MKVRLAVLVLLPAIGLLVMAAIIVNDRNRSLQEAQRAAVVNELAGHVARLDRALGNETMVSALALPGFGETGVEENDGVNDLAEARANTDARLEALNDHLMDSDVGAGDSLLGALSETATTLSFRSDVEAGVVSPLHLADRYGAARSELLAGLSAQASSAGLAGRIGDINGLVALVGARSAHLDERLVVQLAIRYQTWAPGQQAARVRAVTEQDLRIGLAAESAVTPRINLTPPSQLVSTRSVIGSTPEAPSVTVAGWLDISDQWLALLNAAIDDADAMATERIEAAESDAVEARRNAVIGLIVVLTVTVASAAAVSVRLARHLGRFGELVEAIASGDPTDVERLDDNRSDEIGELARSLNRMTSSLANIADVRISVLEAVVSGRDLKETLDLTAVLLGTNSDGSARHQFRLEAPSPEAGPLPGDGDTRLWLVDRATGQPSQPPATPEARLGIRLAAMACHRTSAEADLMQKASIDHLTGLLNRRSIIDRLTDTLESQEPCMVLYVDLDRFKPINDEHGHAVGDSVLQIQAERLQRFADRHGGVVGRVGGDEFLAVLHTDDPPGTVELVDQYLLPTLTTRISIGDIQDLEVGASIGACVPHQDQSVESAVQCADRSLYRAKAFGRRQMVLGTGSRLSSARSDELAITPNIEATAESKR